ncbi:MAG: hypothetical protein ACXADB_09935 [Candidatus Hermodarchaeia archaeon]|jgi:hypothetical protein
MVNNDVILERLGIYDLKGMLADQLSQQQLEYVPGVNSLGLLDVAHDVLLLYHTAGESAFSTLFQLPPGYTIHGDSKVTGLRIISSLNLWGYLE